MGLLISLAWEGGIPRILGRGRWLRSRRGERKRNHFGLSEGSEPVADEPVATARFSVSLICCPCAAGITLGCLTNIVDIINYVNK